MNFTTEHIRDLREKTGAGMMDCKKALTENNGDMEAAIDWLRKKGLAAAAKKSGRVAAEGLVAVYTDGQKGAVVEVNSETDFVARNDQFQALVSTIAKTAISHSDYESVGKAAFPATGRSVAEEVAATVGSIGENLVFRRAAFLQVEQGIVASYIHNAVKPDLGKIGILVGLKSTGDKEKLSAFGKQLAMHIAAARPESLNVENLDKKLIERERQIFSEKASASGKPANIIEKMVEGSLRKYYEEVVLLEQVFVIDGKLKVSEVLKNAEKEIGAPVEISGFVRFQLGEGIEKEQSDFAEEVRKAAGAA